MQADEKTIFAGKQIFTANCVACHGSLGNGDGPAAGVLDHHPGILSSPKMWSESDGGLFWKITNVNTPMPYFRDILTLAPKPTDNADHLNQEVDNSKALGQSNSDSMATGGRIGFMPAPHFEIGFGLQNSDVGPQATNIKALLQSADINAVCESRAIMGQLNILGQWVWQNVGNVVYDADSALGFGPKTFNNRRNGK